MSVDNRKPKGIRKAWNGGSIEAAVAAAEKLPSTIDPDGYTLPCAVRVGGEGHGTVIGKGYTLATLILAMERRAKFDQMTEAEHIANICRLADHFE